MDIEDTRRPTRLTLLILGLTVPLVVGFGLLSLLLVVGRDGVVRPYWGFAVRIVLLAVSLAGASIAGVIVAVVYRQDVKGIPAARVEPAGVRIGGVLVPWSHISAIGPFSIGSNRYLELIISKRAASNLPLIDRLLWRRYDGQGLARIVVSERQFGCPIESAVARVSDYQPRDPGSYPLQPSH